MADIPQEVREDPYQVVAEMLEYFDGHNLATWAPLASIIERERKAMFLAGKRAGMERAAEIADDHCYSLDIDKFAAMTKKEHGAYACRSVAEAIRSENDG